MNFNDRFDDLHKKILYNFDRANTQKHRMDDFDTRIAKLMIDIDTRLSSMEADVSAMMILMKVAEDERESS